MHRIIFATITAVVFVTITQSSLGATVAHWQFEGAVDTTASGADTILEQINGLHGTPHGGPVYRSITSPVGDLGLEFDGIDDRVRVADDPLLALTGSLTLEAIVRIDKITPDPFFNQILFRGDSRAGFDPYFLAVNPSGQLSFHVEEADGTQSNLTSPDPLPLNTVLHVAGSLDALTGEQRLYVNGVEVGFLSTTVRPFELLEPTLQPGLGLGALPGGGQWLDGIIAEARISDQALAPGAFLPTPGTLGVMSMGFLVLARRRRLS